MSKIKIFALGGLNEDGKNMYVVDVDNDMFIFDAGLKYADDKNAWSRLYYSKLRLA